MTQPPRTYSDRDARGIALIRELIEARQAGRLDRVAEIWARDGVLEYPAAPAELAHVIPTRLEGGEKIVQRLRSVLTLAGRIHNAIDEITPLGAGQYLVAYNEDSEMADGRRFVAHFVALVRVSRGRIRLWREYFEPTVILDAFAELAPSLGDTANSPGEWAQPT